jgi:hypothetical protein
MKRTVRLAALAHNVAIVVLLLSAAALALLALAQAVSPGVEHAVSGLSELSFGLLGVAFVVMVATGFHIAVADALDRMERRSRNTVHDDTQ